LNKVRTAFTALSDRNTLLLLRVPFSYYLFPVFLFGISQALNIHAIKLIIVLIAQHFFIYPGSNIYNSYMDKDEGAIGGLEKPPPVTKNMYYVSMVFDIAGLLICALAGWGHVLVMIGYIVFSKSYSWYGIRLKKYPYLGWLSVMFFQGGYTFMQGHMAATDNVSVSWFTLQNIEAMLFASLIIGGSYPLTQIYQHEEDGERGDYTISYRLGVMGTFTFTSIFFTAGSLIALHYFYTYFSLSQFIVFLICTAPVVIYFTSWMLKAKKDRSQADYKHAMLMNKISATCMIICFIVITYLNQSTF
jgi:1,4-dihydroxy-2-naphthoate octaprenyltransferase